MKQSSRILHLVGMLLAAGTIGCDQSPMAPPSPPRIGTFPVQIRTDGSLPDPDGYALVLDSGPPRYVSDNDSVEVLVAAGGTHLLSLTGLAANCAVMGPAERDWGPAADMSGGALFEVACNDQAVRGILVVSLIASGVAYGVAIDGAPPVGPSLSLGSPVLLDVSAGRHYVTLIPRNSRASDCDLPKPISPLVGAGDTTQVAFHFTPSNCI